MYSLQSHVNPGTPGTKLKVCRNHLNILCHVICNWHMQILMYVHGCTSISARKYEYHMNVCAHEHLHKSNDYITKYHTSISARE